MRKFSLFMLMAVGLLISASMSAGPAKVAPTREAKPDMPQVEKPQPFAMVQVQGTSMHKAPRKAALSTEAISDDQVMLKVGETEIGLKSIVEAFKYVNESATDSATIILQKDIDLAYTDWQSTGAGVSLAAGKKAMLDLNGFNFTSSINTGSGWGNDDGKGTCLIQNNGIMYIQDNTFDASAADLLPENNEAPTKHAIIFYEETPDACKTHNDYPYYASNAVSNYGNLTISNCKILNNSKGGACYCIDHTNSSRNISLWVESGYLFSKYCNAVRQYITSGKNTNNFTLDGGVLVGGGACVWTQFNSGTGTPTSVTNFSGGKCIAGYGSSDPSEYYSYCNYDYGVTSFKNVEINLSGTEFVGDVFLLGDQNSSAQDGLKVNIHGGKFNNYLYAYYKNVNMNIYDGVFDGTLYVYGSNSTFDISGGTFNKNVYDYYGKNNTYNIKGGTFNGAVYSYCSNHVVYNVEGGHFGSWLYLNYTYGNSEINITGGTFCNAVIDQYADYFEVASGSQYATKNKIVVTGGLFRSDIYEYEYSKLTSTIDITGGYYAYGKADHGRGYSSGEDLSWLSYVNSDYDAIINGTGKEDMKPWIIDEDEYYYYKIDKKTRKELEIPEDAEPDPENPGNKKVEWGEDGVSGTTQGQGSTDPKQVVKDDNLVVPENTTLVITEGTTAEVKNLVLGQDAVVVVEPGAKMNVGDNGVEIEPDADNVKVIVKGGGQMEVGAEGFDPEAQLEVRSDENGNGAFYVSPNADASTLNNVIVKLFVKKAHKKLKDDADQFVGNEKYDYYWQHIAIPTKGKPNFSNDRECKSFIYRLDPRIGEWEELTSLDQFNEPFRGYMICPNREEVDGVTYTFTGDIIGNGDQIFHFKNKGYNFFGNSYTAPIDVQTLVDNIGQDVELTVWIYDVESRNYIESNNLMRVLRKAKFDKISSMQGFFMRIRGDEYGVDGDIDYADAVWKNRILTENPMIKSPKRAALQLDYSLATLSFATANHEDQVILVEGNEFTNDFDNGNDASKMKGEGVFNVFANTVAGELACVATNELEGTMIAFNAGNEREYTVTFNDIAGEEYALVDLVTGMKIEMTDGVSYTFTAEPNSVCEARFMISSSQKSPTAMGNISTMQKVNGIYTLLGAYVGKTADWHILPAGVYVIDGHKVIK